MALVLSRYQYSGAFLDSYHGIGTLGQPLGKLRSISSIHCFNKPREEKLIITVSLALNLVPTGFASPLVQVLHQPKIPIKLMLGRISGEEIKCEIFVPSLQLEISMEFLQILSARLMNVALIISDISVASKFASMTTLSLAQA